jgi:hypothetical protein
VTARGSVGADSKTDVAASTGDVAIVNAVKQTSANPIRRRAVTADASLSIVVMPSSESLSGRLQSPAAFLRP